MSLAEAVKGGFEMHFAWGTDGHGAVVYQWMGSDVTLQVSCGGETVRIFVPTEFAASIGAALIKAAGISEAEAKHLP